MFVPPCTLILAAMAAVRAARAAAASVRTIAPIVVVVVVARSVIFLGNDELPRSVQRTEIIQSFVEQFLVASANNDLTIVRVGTITVAVVDAEPALLSISKSKRERDDLEMRRKKEFHICVQPEINTVPFQGRTLPLRSTSCYPWRKAHLFEMD